MKKVHFVGIAGIAVVLVLAIPFLRGPTKNYERSVICNFKKDALDQSVARSGWDNADCYIKELVDNWYYVVGEIGWFQGTTNYSEAVAAPTLFVQIRSGETPLSREYADFCEEIFVSTISNNQTEIVDIMKNDSTGGFSLSCPAEETSNAT
ncbi:hypothetical protein [uncultured Ruegeria sp.]|uniref:hypothetical protein n=1 Tax=uncultured Ruegeria sp. TaxID=259304 RepID=UPI002625899E|nr:hypothetical protein [uncultured Ruegeria sp.]